MTRIPALLLLLPAAAFPALAAKTGPAGAAPPRAEASPAAAPGAADRDWGPPTDGLQIRVRVLKAAAPRREPHDGPNVDSLVTPAQSPAPALHTQPGEPMELALDVWNRGKRTYSQAPVPSEALVEMDGTWYGYTGSRAIRAPVRPFKPGDRVEGWITVSLEGPWTETRIGRGFAKPALANPKRLQLTPGKHVLRVAFPFYRGEIIGGKWDRAFSNPVRIQVAFPILQERGQRKEAARDAPPSSARTASAPGSEGRAARSEPLLPVYSETGHGPAFLAEFVNDTNAPLDVAPELELDGKTQPPTTRGGVAHAEIAHLLPGERKSFTISLESSPEAPLVEGHHTLLVRIGGKQFGPTTFVWEDRPRTGP